MRRRPVAVYRVVDEVDLLGEESPLAWPSSGDHGLPPDARPGLVGAAPGSSAAGASGRPPAPSRWRRSFSGALTLSLLGAAVLIVVLGGRPPHDGRARRPVAPLQLALSPGGLPVPTDERAYANKSRSAPRARQRRERPAHSPTAVGVSRTVGEIAPGGTLAQGGASAASEFGFER
jgi:hypothetical protein